MESDFPCYSYKNPRIPIIIFTGSSDEKIGIDAVKKDAQEYLVKGQINGRLLKRSIQHLLSAKSCKSTHK